MLVQTLFTMLLSNNLINTRHSQILHTPMLAVMLPPMAVIKSQAWSEMKTLVKPQESELTPFTTNVLENLHSIKLSQILHIPMLEATLPPMAVIKSQAWSETKILAKLPELEPIPCTTTNTERWHLRLLKAIVLACKKTDV